MSKGSLFNNALVDHFGRIGIQDTPLAHEIIHDLEVQVSTALIERGGQHAERSSKNSADIRWSLQRLTDGYLSPEIAFASTRAEAMAQASDAFMGALIESIATLDPRWQKPLKAKPTGKRGQRSKRGESAPSPRTQQVRQQPSSPQ